MSIFGGAKSEAFMLGTATVMLGAQEDVLDLTPANSLGLVKNFRATQERTFTELTQGKRNTPVFSTNTASTTKATMEVYEYTAANMAYGLGLEGFQFAAQTAETVLGAAVVANDDVITVDSATGFAVGDYITIQVGSSDNITVRKIDQVVGTDLQLNAAIKNPIPVGATVKKSNVLSIGGKAEDGFLAAKIVGELANGDEVTMLFGKVRVTNGFSIGFTTNDFDNMPFELTMYDLLPSDPHYAFFEGEQGKLITSK